MKLFADTQAVQLLKNKYIYLDNDFLGQLFTDVEFFKESIKFLSSAYFLIDHFTQFEFLRDVFLPQQSLLKEKFLEQSYFLPAVSHNDIDRKVEENALLLSKIYAHKGYTKNTRISLVDLFLASRVMYQYQKAVLITGNKKDFPACIFDILTVLNVEQKGDGSIKSFCVIEFNKNKFDKCYEELLKLER